MGCSVIRSYHASMNPTCEVSNNKFFKPNESQINQISNCNESNADYSKSFSKSKVFVFNVNAGQYIIEISAPKSLEKI
ncbi:unnamed protein product [Blepharisma stoltei]|uniref:Uncharacterized protein n=1 Tax=Blepharisma stoltei TaxID=1481888 RepID=A0AAU9JMC5_9CILI|nr:unnamed protein product [Blepharisma stoltei]